MSPPSKSFQQSHLVGDAERERNSIAWRTTGITIVCILALLMVLGAVTGIHRVVRDHQCNQACIATGIRDAGFSKPHPNKFMTRFCVCQENMLLELVHEERARRLKD